MCVCEKQRLEFLWAELTKEKKLVTFIWKRIKSITRINAVDEGKDDGGLEGGKCEERNKKILEMYKKEMEGVKKKPSHAVDLMKKKRKWRSWKRDYEYRIKLKKKRKKKCERSWKRYYEDRREEKCYIYKERKKRWNKSIKWCRGR